MSSDPPNGAPSRAPDGAAAAPGGESRSAEADELELAGATRARGEELLEVLESHAPGEGAHARATGTYAFVAAVAAGQGRGRAELIREAAKLHTVGKLYESAELPAPPREPRAPAERERPEAHHEAGVALARGAGIDDSVCSWVLHSRERFDGRGPDRMAGAQIPIESRVIRVACRCARSFAAHPVAQAPQAAARELRARAGKELDPGIAEALAAMLERTATPPGS